MRYTKLEFEEAQNKNILDYLMSTGYEFKNEGGEWYRSKEHSSLVINRNGQWHWNSKDLHGNKPIELLKQLLVHDNNFDEKSAYIYAIKTLADTSITTESKFNVKPPIPNPYPDPTPYNKDIGNFVLPEKNINNNRVIAYLCKTRKIDFEIVKSLIAEGNLYETKDYHNACFLAQDKNGVPKHAYLRGTLSDKDFKQDINNSDKNYGFLLKGNSNARKVYVFESTIDALSHYTLYKMFNFDYTDGHRLSQHGVSFGALDTFLKDNPKIIEIVACFDNDEAGRKIAAKLIDKYSQEGYSVDVNLPKVKDYNLQLQKIVEMNEIEVSQDLDREA